MNQAELQKIIQQGRGLRIEFKTITTELSPDIFESICGFLNRDGGHLVLGIKEDGEIEGIPPETAQDIKNTLLHTTSTPQKLNPSVFLSPQIVDYQDKLLIHLWVPQSSQVHRTDNKIIDRNEHGNIDITDDQAHLTKLYVTKQLIYTEDTIYPFMRLEDLREDLFEKAKCLLPKDSPLLGLDNLAFLKALKHYQKDYKTGKEGITLAGALLFGQDQVIGSVCPQYRTDALLKVKNVSRYDDRDDIRTNLLDAYDRLMNFIEKHLPDPFFLEGDTRISLRNIIFREVVANTLIHREYSSAYPARFIIEKDRIVVDNWNTPRFLGALTPDNAYPQPKNPNIANFFKLIGRADELGSGIRNTYEYCRHYANGKSPQFEEGEVFKTIIPLPESILSINEPINISNDTKEFANEPINKENDTITTPDDTKNDSNDTITTPNDTKNGINEPINSSNDTNTFVFDTINAHDDTINDTKRKTIEEGLLADLGYIITATIKERLITILLLLIEQEGATSKEIYDLHEVSEITTKRDLEILKKANLLKFAGGKRNGKYVLTEEALRFEMED